MTEQVNKRVILLLKEVLSEQKMSHYSIVSSTIDAALLMTFSSRLSS